MEACLDPKLKGKKKPILEILLDTILQLKDIFSLSELKKSLQL